MVSRADTSPLRRLFTAARLPASPTSPSSSPTPLLPYTPNNGGSRLPLSAHTLPPDAVGVDGILHLDTHKYVFKFLRLGTRPVERGVEKHALAKAFSQIASRPPLASPRPTPPSLYGHAEAAATHRALKALNATSRPFILTRSSFVGTGAYAAHWTGDNAATWADLAWSVGGVLASGLAGLPMAGADVCGFSRDTEPELCSRWIGVAALQPFFRDHSDLNASPQELYRWPETAATARAALAGLRYSLLPTLYSALARAAETGAPAARPLWWEWPGVAGARADDTKAQWMVGDAVMAAPAIHPGVTTVHGWLPPGSAWVDVRPLLVGPGGVPASSGRGLSSAAPRPAAEGGGDAPSPPALPILRAPATAPGGVNVTLDAPLTGAPPALLRCGRVLPTAIVQPGRTAEQTLVEAVALRAVACVDGGDGAAAVGELWSDDGVSDPTPATAAWFDMSADGRGLSISPRNGDVRLEPGLSHWPRLVRAIVIGVQAEPPPGSVKVAACGKVAAVAGTVQWAGGVLQVDLGSGGVGVVCGDGTAGVRLTWGASTD
jgi:hypothetical protein